MRLAILDSDRVRGAAMIATLSGAGHGCTHFVGTEALCAALRHERFDLLLIDADTPDMAPAELLAWIALHAAGQPPVIALADPRNTDAPGEWRARHVEDLLVKPVAAATLLSRVDAILRRHYRRRAPAPMIEVYGEYRFDPMAMTVSAAGQSVELTAKEFGLALFLFRNLDKPIARAKIMESVWGRVPDLPSRTLDAHVSQIRGRLRLRPENGLRLASVYSFGYRLETVEASRAAG
jgi:DNA-binding response OmpR family regulator